MAALGVCTATRFEMRVIFPHSVWMRSRPYDQIASLLLSDGEDNEVAVSAVLHRDPHFLHINRISLIGTRADEIALLRLTRGAVIHWQVYGQTISQPEGSSMGTRRRWGTGWVRKSAMTWGEGIAANSIQPFADIQILEAHDDVQDKRSREQRSEYLFLQRPQGWFVTRRNWPASPGSRQAGVWRNVNAMGVRFRLLQVSHWRDDDRLAQEYEQIFLPGVEIAPTSGDSLSFFDDAERLWFLLRTLLLFRFRQFVSTLSNVRTGVGTREESWHAVRLEPRERELDRLDPPFLGPLESYLANGLKALLAMESDRELLHAAAYGYANSYKSGVMEASLTSAMEGLERLVEAFEHRSGLTREAIPSKRWRKLGSAAREAARPCGISQDERDAIDRALSGAPNLHLIERLQRMTKALPSQWRGLPDELLAGASGMINARNSIVHGRMVKDLDALRIEILRAQTLFERLWLGLLKSGGLKSTGWAAYEIRVSTAVGF